jgi:hypothetical protein
LRAVDDAISAPPSGRVKFSAVGYCGPSAVAPVKLDCAGGAVFFTA